MRKRSPKRRRSMRFESLEERRVLAGFISEINLAADDYIELRGNPNEMNGDFTYLALVESESIFDIGTIRGLFDLGGTTYGNNGFLVLGADTTAYDINPLSVSLMQDQSFRANSADPDIFTGTASFGLFPSYTAIFFQALDAVSVGDDIDADNDGMIDAGIETNWEIFDSVTAASATSSSVRPIAGYGQTVFAPDGANTTLQAGSQLVTLTNNLTSAHHYVGRQGDSTGHGEDHWVAAELNNRRLGLGLFAESATPERYTGRRLDHVGTFNFDGGVKGRVFNSDIQEQVAGVRILADANGNGTQDQLRFVLEPDSVAPGVEVTNHFRGVTLTQTWFDLVAQDPIYSQTAGVFGSASTGSQIFSSSASSDSSFWSESFRFKADFYRPVEQVSIDVIGESRFFGARARLETYGADGQLLKRVDSQLLTSNFVQRLVLDADPGEPISFFTVHSLDFSGNISLDRISYLQNEAVGVTDAQGNYEINDLVPGTYDIMPLENDLLVKVPATGTEQIEVTDNENFVVDFLTGNNNPPVIEVVPITIDEHTPSGTIIHTVVAQDPDPGQSQRFRIVGGDRRIFAINVGTGELRVINSRDLDFETSEEFTLDIEVVDDFSPALSDTQTFTITVQDVNEAPVIERSVFSIPETAAAGTVFDANIIASDADGDQFTLAIDDDEFGDAFEIDPETGELTLVDASILDFETNGSLLLGITATDDAPDDPQTGFGEVVIRVTDENEAPSVDPAEVSFPETSPVGSIITTLSVTDQDAGQEHTFEIVEGNDAGIFSLDATTGVLTLSDQSAIDFEQTALYQLQIIATDNGLPPLPSSEPTTIDLQITDVDEAPIITVVTDLTPENSPPGTRVATITAVDPEDGIPQSRILAGGDLFDFDEQTGALTIAEGTVLDFEGSIPVVSIEFSDTSFPPHLDQRDFPIIVTDVAEAPRITQSIYQVSEQIRPNQIAFEVPVFDPDDNVSSYSIVGGTGAGIFNISSITGAVSLATGSELDFEQTRSYTLDVQVTDSTTLSDTLTVAVDVVDANEAPQIDNDVILQDLARAQSGQPIVAGREFAMTISNSAFFDQDDTEFVLDINSQAGAIPDWLSYDPDTLQLRGTPTNADIGTTVLTLRLSDTKEPPLSDEFSFTMEIQRNPTPWQNPVALNDVNRDGDVQSIDALIILNFLDRNGSVSVPQDVDPTFYYDVDGDNLVRPIDALRIVNQLTLDDQNSANSEFVDDVISAIALDVASSQDDDEDDYALALDAALS